MPVGTFQSSVSDVIYLPRSLTLVRLSRRSLFGTNWRKSVASNGPLSCWITDFGNYLSTFLLSGQTPHCWAGSVPELVWTITFQTDPGETHPCKSLWLRDGLCKANLRVIHSKDLVPSSSACSGWNLVFQQGLSEWILTYSPVTSPARLSIPENLKIL